MISEQERRIGSIIIIVMFLFLAGMYYLTTIIDLDYSIDNITEEFSCKIPTPLEKGVYTISCMYGCPCIVEKHNDSQTTRRSSK